MDSTDRVALEQAARELNVSVSTLKAVAPELPVHKGTIPVSYVKFLQNKMLQS